MVKSWHLCSNSKGDQKIKSTWSDFTLMMMVKEKPPGNKIRTLPLCVAMQPGIKFVILMNSLQPLLHALPSAKSICMHSRIAPMWLSVYSWRHIIFFIPTYNFFLWDSTSPSMLVCPFSVGRQLHYCLKLVRITSHNGKNAMMIIYKNRKTRIALWVCIFIRFS